MEVFLEISLIIVIATLISAVMRLLKQPLIIGYILTGLIAGPYFLNIIKTPDALQVFAEFGIALLLFIVGLNLRPTVIREVGKIATITGVGQVLFTVTIGFLICLAFGFSYIESAYISVALTFSSTIIILKLLSDKGALEKLYGKISVGFLLVQDIIATIILILISAFAMGSTLGDIAFQITWKGAAIAVFLFLISKFVLGRLLDFFARSQEFLFLFSIAWGLGVASLFSVAGFSMEIGALVAGVLLSLSSYSYEISAKMRPLRDFFLVVFFILLGAQLIVGSLAVIAIPAIIFSLFVLIGNPLIVITLMGLLGYGRRIGFMAGLTVAQISEFSLILIALGIRVGHISDEILSLVTLVGLITIAGSSYMIIYSDKIYPLLSNYLKIFEKANPITASAPPKNYDVILFGYNRVGYDFLNVFIKNKYNFIVVDFDPAVVKTLEEKGIKTMYGDAGDDDLLEELDLRNVKLIVSTIPDYDVNSYLLEKLNHINPEVITMVVSHSNEDTLRLYNTGASYMIMPHFLGGKYSAAMINKFGFERGKFLNEQRKHKMHIDARMRLGHIHPTNS